MPALSALFFQKKSHFGLAISRTAVRAIELNQQGKITKAVEVLLPEETFKPDATVNTDNLETAFKKLLAVGKFSTEYVSVCFSEIYAYNRQFSLPVIPYDEVHEALSWHIKELFPFSQEDIYYDWKLLSASDNQLIVSIVAVQKHFLDALVETITKVGLKPLSLQSTASVISQLLKLKDDQAVVIAEVNKPGAYVTLLQGQKVFFTTVVSSSKNDTPESYFKNVNDTTNEIIQYYHAKKTIASTQLPVIFTGVLADAELIKRASQVMTNPVKILKTPIAKPAFNKAYAVAVAPVFPPEDENSINLLPPAAQSVYDQEITKAFYTRLFSRLCVFLTCICSVSVATFILISVQRNSIDGQIKTISNAVNSQKANTQNLLILNASAKAIVALAPMRATPKEKLLVILSLISDKVQINQWNFDDSKQQFILKGQADDRADLLAFKQKIEASGEFANISLPLGSLETPKNIRFTITFLIAK